MRGYLIKEKTRGEEVHMDSYEYFPKGNYRGDGDERIFNKEKD